MTTPFIKELASYNIKNIHIELAFDFENNIVSVLTVPKSPAEDQATKILPQLVITAPIDQIDPIYFEKLNTPLKVTQNFFDSTVDFEEKLAINKANSKQAENLKKEIKKLEEVLKKIKTKTDFDYSKDKVKIKKAIDEIFALDASNSLAKKEEKELKENAIKENTLFNN